MPAADPKLEVHIEPIIATADEDGRRLGDPERIPALRTWAAGLFDRHPVRDAVVWTSRAAAVRRMVGVGVGHELQHYSARDTLQVALCVKAPVVVLSLTRAALTLALIEDDREVVDGIVASGALPDVAAWLALLDGMDPAQALAHDGLPVRSDADPIQRAVNRLRFARRLPQILQPAWWTDAAAVSPAAAAGLLLVAIDQRDDLRSAAAAFLAARHEVLAAIDSDRLLAPLVHRSASKPSSTLLPFEGWYGDPTVLAAASWHLEHGQAADAITVAARVRPLSDQRDAALLITGLALIELQRLDQAIALLRQFDDESRADELRLRLAAHHRGGVADEAVAQIARQATPQQGERFFIAVRLLLGRRRLDLARTIARERQSAFLHVPPVRDALAAILRGAP